MKCKKNGYKCIIDMDAQQTLGGQIVCDMAEEYNYDKVKILQNCKYARTSNMQEEVLKEIC